MNESKSVLSRPALAAPIQSGQAVGYTRVSTQEQVKEGVSLAAQRSRIEAYATAQGLVLLDVYTDEGLSGRKTSNRPALEAAVNRVSEIKGSLIVYSVSRLARS